MPCGHLSGQQQAQLEVQMAGIQASLTSKPTAADQAEDKDTLLLLLPA
jgi:hypothetical protein